MVAHPQSAGGSFVERVGEAQDVWIQACNAMLVSGLSEPDILAVSLLTAAIEVNAHHHGSGPTIAWLRYHTDELERQAFDAKATGAVVTTAQ